MVAFGVVFLLGVLDGTAQGLTEADRDSTNGMCSTRRANGSSSTSADSRDRWDGANRDQYGTQDAHGFGVLVREEVEGAYSVQEPYGRVGHGGNLYCRSKINLGMQAGWQ